MEQARGLTCYVIGADSLLIECGEILLREGFEVRGVITATERIAAWAEERGLAVLDPEDDLAARLGAQPFDYLFSISNLALIEEDVLRLPRRGAINFHDGPLPRYAGLHAPAWALMNGEAEYGVTWHRMESGIDTGAILEQSLFAIADDDTSLTLNTRCFDAAIDSFERLVGDLREGTTTEREQDASHRTYFAKYRRPHAACVLDWTRPATELEALVRALDFGQYRNPLGLPKLVHGDKVLAVGKALAREGDASRAPGTVLAAGGFDLLVQTGDGGLSLTHLSTLGGRKLAMTEALRLLDVERGSRLESIDEDAAEEVTRLADGLARGEERWSEHLAHLEPLELPQAERAPRVGTNGHAPPEPDPVEIPAGVGAACPKLAPADAAAAAIAAFLGRIGGRTCFDLAFSDEDAPENSPPAANFASPVAAWRVEFDPRAPAAEAVGCLARSLASLREGGTWLLDLPARTPALAESGDHVDGLPLDLTVRVGSDAGPTGGVLTLLVSRAGDACRLVADPARLDAAALADLASQLSVYLASLAAHPDRPLAALDLLEAAERERILVEWNDTATDYEREARVHELFEAQVARTPDACALVFADERLTYRELDERAGRLAAHLTTLGAGPDRLVGLHLERSVDLVVALLGVLKSGAAYLPLDPAYPADRLAFMLRDSRAPLVLTTRALAEGLPAGEARIVHLDGQAQEIAAAAPAPDGPPGDPSHLAYVIYTSGSTGEPKGVMVEHRNVASFFAGMDERVPHDPPGTWLAVTSLSFDISVLELLWTLARGFEVVLHADGESAGAPSPAPPRSIDFAMFLWGNDAGQGRKKYELLLESARFADAHGFSSVWTPERHFHAFGGPYPNPSVLGAAVAAVTERVAIRSGSCVAPLHHPLRIAEEWAVVDNLSEGRVGLGIASGWQPHDFVLRPENYAEHRECMFRDIEIVRSLWRGEALEFPGPDGEPIERVTYPRPIQPELPIWLTTAGNPDTYERAGEIGAHILTHLLGQPIEEVAEKIRTYRASLAAHGHDPEAFTVTLMLHTFVGEDVDEVRELVREPMKAYLGSAVDLVKKFAWTFPAFKRPGGVDAPVADIDVESLTGAEAEAILEHAFLRYFDSSGLFGTPESCIERIDQLKSIGVDEVGCLIDYGLPTDVVLASLPTLGRLREAVQPAAPGSNGVSRGAAGGRDDSLAALVERHGVTHMQCTPSMARMLLDHDESRAALAGLRHLLVGGEALPAPLATDLGAVLEGSLTNMYGPTETTIWSATQALRGDEDTIPIGRPIANTRLYILDEGLQPVPVGVPGELYIGGDGVVRGYHERPALTAERFLPDPFAGAGDTGGRIYRTGDRARYRPDGVVEFLGRTDHQVKVRGHRIELGEIEAVLGRHEAVESCAVIVREDQPGDQRIVAYHTPTGGAGADTLRDALREVLPEFMVPTHVIGLERLPLTPNGKIDRKALPPPGELGGAAGAVFVAPGDGLEATIAEIWQAILRCEQVGVDDNFFDIGGHSLLVVQVHRSLRERVERPVELTDLYRFPTVRTLAAYLGTQDGPRAAGAGADRGRRRRVAMRRRRGGRTQET
ncbi:MAG: LLM class flavin-dependent oxidoreductase [Planctomycetota bacterium]|jgi:natural product biosynthesis luciferase-like monooxygenase protein|nr:LLM class flavin-dependent oxidoreductase [Planctomycetota bacterium]MDP6990627.1 LLM class flavin-dependent oxidoreductase [Planctomycetota bacterium]